MKLKRNRVQGNLTEAETIKLLNLEKHLHARIIGQNKAVTAVADVVRNLSFKQKEKGLSTGEKKMLNNAKQILVSELVLAEHASQEEVEEIVETKINTSFNLFKIPRLNQTNQVLLVLQQR